MELGWEKWRAKVAFNGNEFQIPFMNDLRMGKYLVTLIKVK